jgi:choline kinase
MNKHVRKIKDRVRMPDCQIIILSAGIGSRTKSYEPRCLLKYQNKVILDNQIDILSQKFSDSEISVVCGFDYQRIMKRVGKRARIVENSNFENTNNGESLKLGINNSLKDNILFLHGDLFISSDLFTNIVFNKSFILVDSSNKFDDKEVGVTIVNGQATVLSYALPTKWCQIAFITGAEMNIVRKLFHKQDFNCRYLLTFEIINKIIELGGSFECYDIGNSFIKEIDNLKDINNENIS